uniref:RNA helicase n=1 Tax=Chromera velia CCMP2878 TaxID=1169474 RepID=A0A0G4GIM2_9ALVE|mmetsp:Transcript_15943/g.32335  ORF Transcript_15943/g.32335 Transcript_15943/m.32335 type:complete len:525 (-) Transcript_15943:604-2178(-)|eukprot:Cvel_22070.t1-p1 / transcript=Cvel_22070.t1 / gene=Cvel_22070 / organism=Chromera_velia_CCMP2878 / gene_product=ATP-dependent RNA helicase DBP3, putative / transcript_product=ATP-dependent RNA helicase DBP3, putative / location=Cvel_scaffold2132:26776-29649(-) / protein_length=524 / sequence_SO=supercontig / SO=protein_coding / is_pseudo=false
MDGSEEKAAKKKKRARQEQEEAATAAASEEAEKAAKKQKKKKDKKEQEQSEEEQDSAAAAFRSTHHIVLEGPGSKKKKFAPIESFKDAPFSDVVLSVCKDFKNPTPIQAQAWPIQITGRDMIGIARTGSGKTLAFGMPIFQKIVDGGLQVSKGSPLALVICPTRELALQSQEVFEKASSSTGIRTVCIYGGVSKADQRDLLRKKVHAIIATPGRLKAFLEEEIVSLKSVETLVLDEADRMLDMGFEEDMRLLIGSCPESRQTVMFSATWPETVRSLASEFLSKPMKVTIGLDQAGAGGKLAVSDAISQTVEIVEDKKKNFRLLDLLRKYANEKGGPGKNVKILVFALYKKEAAFLGGFLQKQLKEQKLKVASIHGDMSQEARSASLESFKTGESQVLVATDVAGRGLDIPLVDVVINATFPLTIEDYVHRIGRTGRGGRKGTSHTLFTAGEKDRAGALIDVLRGAGAEVPKSLLDLAGVKEGDTGPADSKATKKKKHDLYGDHFKDVDLSQKGKHTTFADSDSD